MRVNCLLAISDKANNKSHTILAILLPFGQWPHWKPRRLREDNTAGDVRFRWFKGTISALHPQDRVQWLTPRSRALLEKLIIHQLVNKSPPKVQHCAHNDPPLHPSQLNPILIFPPSFFPHQSYIIVPCSQASRVQSSLEVLQLHFS
jgi:hypothetical protein